MATTESALLTEVKTQIKALTPSSPAAGTNKVYVTPDDYDTIAKAPRPPFVIINRQQEAFTTERRAHSGVRSSWNLEIYIFLHAGELPYPSQDFADAELAAREWWSAVVDWIYGTTKPFSTHGMIAGALTADFTAMQFNQLPYNGLYMTVPVLHNV